MITYSWEISALEYYPHKNGFDKVVHCVHWILKGVDDENHQATVYGSQTLPTDDLDPDKYIAYDSLTKEEVVSWLESAMGAENLQSYQNAVQTQINNIINPPNVTTSPPWESN